MCLRGNLELAVSVQTVSGNIDSGLSDNFLSFLKEAHICRSSHLWCSVKKIVFRDFAKFTGKHLCHSLDFIKVAG